jgi:hypothetical protein
MDNINISLADPVRSLLDEIANIDPKTRLYRYATARLELTAGDLAECRRAHPDAGYWLSLRAEAGQPGQALPSRSEALTRLQAGEASLEDVASWLLTPGDEIVEPDTLIPLHQHALAVAFEPMPCSSCAVPVGPSPSSASSSPTRRRPGARFVD